MADAMVVTSARKASSLWTVHYIVQRDGRAPALVCQGAAPVMPGSFWPGRRLSVSADLGCACHCAKVLNMGGVEEAL